MKTYKIKRFRDGSTLFSGQYRSFKECLENAIKANTDLTGADLRYKNLTNGNFDNAFLPDSCFRCTNLTGANLSEANLRGGAFHHASLYNACLNYSDLSYCDFQDANFGATDIAGSTLNFSKFSTLSCFDLDFRAAASLEGCVYAPEGENISHMSGNPIIVKGLFSCPLVIFDHDVRIGNKTFARGLFPELLELVEYSYLQPQKQNSI